MFLGFPGNGQKTRSNGKRAEKNNNSLLNLYCDILKFYKNIKLNVSFKILLRAQVLNKSWYYFWHHEWDQGRVNSYFLKPKKIKKFFFNLEKLSNGQGVGFLRKGAASKRGKARNKMTYASVGMPLNLLKVFTVGDKSSSYKFCTTTK